MNVLQKALEKIIQDAPDELLADTVAEKLRGLGINLTARERRKLIQHLRSNGGDSFSLSRRAFKADRSYTIDLAAEDGEAIHRRFTAFLEQQLPELIHSTIDDLALALGRDLRRRWSVEAKRQNRDLLRFRKNISRHWGKAIERLKMFNTIAREFGEWVNATEIDPASAHRRNVLSRLHARGCQVTEEVICLLSAGLADGAMARWRTLHEIAVVALFLANHDDEVAKRYTDHEVVESFRAVLEYQQYCPRLNQPPVSESEIEQLRRAFDQMVKKYGKSFKTQYGWAADVLRSQRPRFKDIEQAVGIDQWRAYYRLASHNVHSNPKGVFFKLGLVDEVDILLAGPSNVGLADPGHCTALSLLHISTAFGTIAPTLDLIVALKILANLEKDVGETFLKAHRRLEGDLC